MKTKKYKVSNAEFQIKLQQRHGFWEFTGFEVIVNSAFDTELEALRELEKVFGNQIKIHHESK